MSVSPLNRPVNVLICKSDGTIFSAGSGSGGGGGTTYSFVNLGPIGARVLAGVIANNVQFRKLIQGTNVTLTENPNDITLAVNDLAFDSTAAVKRPIPGLQGVSLGKTGILATLQELLYPVISPIVSLSLSITQFEYGDNSNIIASWGVTRTDEPILTIQVGVNSIAGVTGNTQNGTQAITKDGTSPVNVLLVATTATRNANVSRTAAASRKIRVGASNKNGTTASMLDSDLNALSGFYSSSKSLTPQTIIIGESQYLVIEIPTLFTGGNTPIFKINGFVNNAFTKVRSNNTFVNSFGFADLVDVFVSNAFSTGTITVEIV